MNTKGFTIVETLVAITILMISIAGPMTIAQKSLNAALYAKDQVIATYLAQDKVEYIKAQKTAAVRAGNFVNWVNNYATNNICDDSACPLTILDPNYGPYTDDGSGNIATKFTRQATVTMMGGSTQEAIIKVIVRWQNGTVENATILEDHIFDIELK